MFMIFFKISEMVFGFLRLRKCCKKRFSDDFQIFLHDVYWNDIRYYRRTGLLFF